MPDAGGEGVTLYSLAVELFGDDRRLRRDMDSAAAYSQQAGDRAGSRFALGFQNPLLNAIGGIQQLVGGTQQALGMLSVTTGVQIAATYQRLQLGFTSLTGSASVAKSIMSDLAKMGSSTPFHTEDLTAYAQSLLALGVNANKVTGDLSALADATAARGGSTENLGELSRIVSGFRVRPRLDIREVAEIGRYMDLSKVVGAATGRTNLSTQQAAGILSGQSGAKAYDTIISGAQKVYGGAAAGQGGNTVTGLTQNLQESLTLAMKPTGDALLPVIGGLEKGAISAASAVQRLNESTGGSAGLAFVMIAGVALIRRFGGSARTAWDVTRGLTAAVSDYALAADRAAVAARRGAVADDEKAGADMVAAGASNVGARAAGEAAARGAGEVATLGKGATIGLRVGKLAAGIAEAGIPIAIDYGANFIGDKLKQSHDRETRSRGGTIAGFGAGVGVGAAGGAVVGSFVPVIGTAVGAAIGGLIGGAVGMIKGHSEAAAEEKERAKDTKTIADNTGKTADILQKMSIRVFGGGSMASGTASLLEAEYSLARAV